MIAARFGHVGAVLLDRTHPFFASGSDGLAFPHHRRLTRTPCSASIQPRNSARVASDPLATRTRSAVSSGARRGGTWLRSHLGHLARLGPIPGYH